MGDNNNTRPPTDYLEDFSKAPVTIGELRSDKSGYAHDLTPREGLITILRRIDSGEIDCSGLIITYLQVDADAPDIPYVRTFSAGVATKPRHVSAGMLAIAQALAIGDIED